jgi:predicted HTH transcriptional regulator
MSKHLTEHLENIPAKDLKAIISIISKIDEFKGFWKVISCESCPLDSFFSRCNGSANRRTDRFLHSTPNDILLSPNQQKALNLFDKQKVISTKLISERLKIPTVSAKQILNRLLKLKLIKRIGVGRTTRYMKL